MDKSPKIKAFKTQKDWAKWLAKNYAKPEGIWIKFYKKASGLVSINYDQALDEALCFGWIDGQSKSLDEKAWIQKFTPRRSRSIWSKRNTEHIARLIKLGKMRKPGLAQVAAAKADGRWDQAYDSPGNMKFPEDFLKILSKKKKAKAFFESLSRSNKYAIAWRLQTAKKPETRERRMKQLIKMLVAGEKIH